MKCNVWYDKTQQNTMGTSQMTSCPMCLQMWINMIIFCLSWSQQNVIHVLVFILHCLFVCLFFFFLFSFCHNECLKGLNLLQVMHFFLAFGSLMLFFPINFFYLYAKGLRILIFFLLRCYLLQHSWVIFFP